MTKFFILLICQATVVCASHFRGAIVSWSPTYDESQISVSFRISWRRSHLTLSYYCDDSTIHNRTLIGDSFLTCLTGCSGTVASLQYYCTDYSAVSGDDWSTGRNDVLYTPTAERFSFRFSGCCWIETLNGAGAGGGWSILATADLRVRSDTGRINSSPTVEMTPIFHAQYGCHYNIILPVADVDGDVIKCRWATGTYECNTVCNGFTGAVLDEAACSISYTANQNTSYYAVAIQVEDFTSEISTTPLSSIPLQFLVKVYTGSGCANAPDFVAPTPEENACFALDVGDNFNVTLKARSPESLSGLTTTSAVGMVRSTVVKTQDSSWHYIEVNVSWTPTNDDAGRDHSLCFYATDVFGVSSSARCIKLPVSVTGPTPLRVERVGLTNTWVIVIDQTFSRPTDSAYIIVYEASTNKELLSVDVSNSSDVVFDPLNRQIKVTFDFDFDILEDYHVTIPSGLVEGYVSCGALSVAINDSTFWNIEVDCGELTILNGIVNAPNGTDYPHSITYVCNIGHDLIGNDTRTCTSNGTWTGVEPFCKPRDCGSFLIPAHGYTSTNSTIYATNVTFSCVVGYEISGNSSMTCDHTPAWTSSPPICVIVDCGQLLSPPDGTINISNTTLGSTVAYDCYLGFTIDGDNTRHCLHTGAWNGSDPTCKAVDCGSFLIPVNGYASTNSTIYATNVTFSCVVGYEISGNSSMFCDHTPAWTSSPPICVIIDCGNLTSLVNGIVSTADDTTFKKLAVYSCNLGYDLIGSSSRQCQSNKIWGGVAPSCEPKDCGSFLIPANGYASTTSTIYATNVTFSCVVGYEISGSSSMICDHTPAWTSSPPICVIIDCGTLIHPKSGIVSTDDGTTFNKLAVFSCDLGYDLIGSNSRQCQSNKQWSGVAPSCEPKDCGQLLSPPDGTIHISNTTFGNTVTYDCDLGFIIDGDNTRNCLHTGAWNGSDPTCKAVDCGPIPNIGNGTITFSGTTVGENATASCDIGFDLYGTSQRTCVLSGEWSGLPTRCEIKDCGSIFNLTNGKVTQESTVYGSVTNFTCDYGYELLGSNSSFCLENGSWGDDLPECILKECMRLSDPDDGQAVPLNASLGAVVAFTCNEGYTRSGPNTLNCTLGGTWSENPPICTKDSEGSSVAMYAAIGGGVVILILVILIAVAVCRRGVT